MVALIVTGQVFTDGDKALPRHAVKIEIFSPSSGRWGALSTLQTDNNGRFTFRTDADRLGIQKLAPALRLVENGSPVRVLSPGAMLSVNRSTKDITADFGQVERLDDEAFARTTSAGRSGDMVAGVARKAGLNQGVVLHNLTVDRNLGAMLADRRFSRGDAVVSTNIDRAGAAVVAGVAEDSSKFSAELLTLRRVNSEHTAELLKRSNLIASKDHELSLKQVETDKLTAELAQTRKRAQDAEAELAKAQQTQKGEETDINAAFTNIGTKLGDADQALKARKVPYRLGAIKVDLKGAMGGDGKIFLGGSNTDGSGVSVEMTPDRPEATTPQVSVPDVSGLTQTAAQRVLRSVGLRMTLATQTMRPGTAPHGQSIRQTPAAGSSAPHGSAIMVVFAVVPPTSEEDNG
ncbi:MAG: PASTA domain-containing protein [Marinibacterium sp.]|nr:PASTA domain-containing protein [Marinibacterium sp.]